MTKNTDNTDGIFSIQTFNNLASRGPRFHRVSSMLLDHFLMCVVIVPIGILSIILSQKLGFAFNDGMNFFFWGLVIFTYYNKDFFNAKSPAKRVMGYQVVDRNTEKQATELQCFIRNLTICVVWPIEVVVGFFNPERRIGDYLANTKVVVAEKESLKTIWFDFKKIKLKRNFIGILIIGGVYLYGLTWIFPAMK